MGLFDGIDNSNVSQNERKSIFEEDTFSNKVNDGESIFDGNGQREVENMFNTSNLNHGIGSESEYDFTNNTNDIFSNRRQLRLKSLEILKKGSYKDQYIRNLNVNMGYDSMAKLEEMVSRRNELNLENVSGLDVSLNTPNILDINKAPTSKASIANGWSTERDIFMMEMVDKGSTGYSETVYYIQGYTDYNGITLSGKVDLSMKFFMNTIMVFSRQRNLGTGTVVAKMTTFLSVLHSDIGDTSLRLENMGNKFGLNDEMLLASRPEDIVGTLHSKAAFDGGDVEILPSSIIKTNGRNMESPILSNKSNNTPIQHLTTTLSGLISAQKFSNSAFGRGDLLDAADKSIRQENGFDVEFLRQLALNNGMVEKTFFTLKDLRFIDDTINENNDQRIAFITSSHAGFLKDNKMDYTISEDIYRPTEENRINNIVSSAMTSLLSETGLELLALGFDNEFNKFNVSILGYRTRIEGWDARKLALFAGEKFKKEVLPSITKNNQIYLMGAVTASLMDDTRVSINIGNGMVDFINPTFADSLFNNNISDKNSFDNLASGYSKIVDVVSAMS